MKSGGGSPPTRRIPLSTDRGGVGSTLPSPHYSVIQCDPVLMHSGVFWGFILRFGVILLYFSTLEILYTSLLSSREYLPYSLEYLPGFPWSIRENRERGRTVPSCVVPPR